MSAPRGGFRTGYTYWTLGLNYPPATPAPCLLIFTCFKFVHQGLFSSPVSCSALMAMLVCIIVSRTLSMCLLGMWITWQLSVGQTETQEKPHSTFGENVSILLVLPSLLLCKTLLESGTQWPINDRTSMTQLQRVPSSLARYTPWHISSDTHRSAFPTRCRWGHIGMRELACWQLSE